MSARETAAQREERMAKAAAGRNRGEGAPVKRSSAVRTKPVRMTVDMPPSLHRRLKGWTGFASQHLDVADVPAAEVVRILVELLTTEPDKATEVTRPLVNAVISELRDRQDQQ